MSFTSDPTFFYPLYYSSAKYSPQAKVGPLPVFINKVLLEHSLVHSLHIFMATLAPQPQN